MLQFRASGVGNIMGYPDKDILPDGAKTFIYELASQILLDWKPELDFATLEKGIRCEDESIALINNLLGKNYLKNKTRLKNDYLTGEWDIWDKEEDLIIDIKTAFSKKTFPLSIKSSKVKMYEWQLIAYMALTGAKNAQISYVLVDTPIDLVPKWENPDWHYVSAIDPKLRHTPFKVLYSQEREQQLLNRVKLAQAFLKEILEERGYSFKKEKIDFETGELVEVDF